MNQSGTKSPAITAAHEEARADVNDPGNARAPQLCPRVLFFCSAEPEVASGTPVIVCDLLSHFPSGDAELLCEKSYQLSQRARNHPRPPRHAPVRFPTACGRFAGGAGCASCWPCWDFPGWYWWGVGG